MNATHCFNSVLLSSSVCNEETAIKSLSRTFAERVGSMSLTVSEEISGVVLHFNMSLHNWISYTYVYDMDTLGNSIQTVLSSYMNPIQGGMCGKLINPYFIHSRAQKTSHF